ncbi:hypothetical protein DFH07DRAFT_858952 [Mycena maculata]|uniref:Hydrophobin n=1 Tax=Mycena maculata TaxID=230809 RepID=A0AAD7MJE9_9AGAR|nr:hypothetical protein DFH07DRAFT_858952 [Mycena maculata]
MHFFFAIFLTAATLTGLVFGRPISTQKPLMPLQIGETQCFTERAAITSDCEALLANPPTPNWTNVARTGASPVFNPFCGDSCCVFTDTPYVPTDALLSLGTTLLGCSEPANGLINGVTKTDATGICLADRMGASTCFGSL